jgi:hypothetical protein
MPRALRSDYAGEIYHALNRGNARNDIFFKEADFEAFERQGSVRWGQTWFSVFNNFCLREKGSDPIVFGTPLNSQQLDPSGQATLRLSSSSFGDLHRSSFGVA